MDIFWTLFKKESAEKKLISVMYDKQIILATHRGTVPLLPRETECENNLKRVEKVSQKIKLISDTSEPGKQKCQDDACFFLLSTKLFLFDMNTFL